MVVDLSFWQEFGTFFVAIGVGLIVAGLLVFIGSRAAHVYEKTLASQAAHFRGLPAKLRENRRTSYEEQVRTLGESASGARKVQIVGLYGGTVFLTFHLARAIVGEAALQGSLKWLVIVAIPLLATALVALLERRSARARQTRLDAAADLDAEEVNIP